MTAGGETSHFFGFLHCDLRVAVYPGRVLGLAGAHGTDDQCAAVGFGKVEVIDGMVNLEIRKP